MIHTTHDLQVGIHENDALVLHQSPRCKLVKFSPSTTVWILLEKLRVPRVEIDLGKRHAVVHNLDPVRLQPCSHRFDLVLWLSRQDQHEISLKVVVASGWRMGGNE